MALQQISLGGASAPAAPVDATSQLAQGQTNSVTGLTNQQYLADIADISAPFFPSGAETPQISTPSVTSIPLTGAVAPPSTTLSQPDIQIDPFTSKTPNADDVFIGGGTPQAQAAVAAGAPILGTGNPYPWDPYSFAGSGSQEGSALPSEAASPGYQQFGQSWLDLLNTISTQDLHWGGTNQGETELKGGGSVGPWLTQNILTPWNSGNQQDAYANAVYFISSQTGKPASDPETQQLGGAFLEYTLQNSNRYGANTANFQQRDASNGGKGILGDIEGGVEALASIVQPELAIPFAALNLVQGGIEGNLTPLSAIGDVLQGVGGIGGLDPVDLTDLASDLGTVPSTLSDVATGAKIGASGIGLGEGISQGSLVDSLGPAVSLGTGLYSLAPNSPSGTTGTNAPSGGVVSSVADSLGITSQQLADYAGGAFAAGGAAVPLIQQATAGGSPTLNVSAPLPPPPTPTEPAPTPSASGQPLQPQAIQNPSQATYQQPGPRQANPQELAAILSALGVTT